MRRASFALALLLFLGVSTLRGETQRITASEARDHVGQEATVCGPVASTRYAASSRGQPTFLNLEKPYPNQVFTIVIWGRDRAAFGRPEIELRGKQVCVSGLIGTYRDVPQIEAKKPSQIAIEE